MVKGRLRLGGADDVAPTPNSREETDEDQGQRADEIGKTHLPERLMNIVEVCGPKHPYEDPTADRGRYNGDD